ncbi:HDOD domain-containing protein [Hydrogenophilus thermoluteolus]|uniref:HDOD domain-containing protein n=1 Tax=Hydrogenophilus thermoluteolus TaxID=297 RepID=A0A2Z6DXT9_HYDTE|nr:HDOD domain-containing protein [Hydrogenophilus thermoluteolus]BBD77301.1 HDOD domain-containing protein [Hydrogenophilus thermoluteolus]
MTPRIEEPLADAASWADWFRGQIPTLPLLRQSKRKIDEEATHATEINLHQLAEVVIGDPILTLRTLVQLQQSKKGETRELTSITSALMMLGIQPFLHQIHALPTVESALADQPVALKWLLSRVARARKAAHYAHDWAVLRRDINAEEVTVAALLYEINEILLWLFAPKLMFLMLSLRKRFPDHPIEVLQRKVFNTTDLELRDAAIARFNLPTILKELMNPQNAENPRTRTVLLATRLARHLGRKGWQHPKLEADIEAIEQLVHLNRELLLRRLDAPYEVWPRFGVPVPPTSESKDHPTKGNETQ